MLRCALHIISGIIIYNSRLSRPAGRSKRIFTGGVVTENGICSAAFCESAALRESACSPGGAVAQRLRGYKWRSEKSVKAIAPTGAALALRNYDEFLEFVKNCGDTTGIEGEKES